MKTCPRCRKELEDTALRCRYCRRPLPPKKPKLFTPPELNLEPGYPGWSLAEALLLWLLVFAAYFVIAHFEAASRIMEFLRKRYFILVKEPALQFYISVFISTFLLKLSAVAAIWTILKTHKTAFIKGLKLDAPVERKWLWIFPAFAALAVAVRLICDTDPLSPNLPIYLFFRESSAIGTIIVIFSVCLIAPLAEEIFFRGFMYPCLNKKFGLPWATFITAFLFMAVHIPQDKEHPVILASIFLVGALLALARAFTRSTMAAVLLHAIYNSTLVAVGCIKFLILKY